VGTSQVSQVTKVSIGSAMQNTNNPKKSQKIKWDKNPTKDKRSFGEKKPWDIVKVYCFNYKELGHFVKDYKKVGHNLVQGKFTTKTNVVK
jgi:hypothetical protein